LHVFVLVDSCIVWLCLCDRYALKDLWESEREYVDDLTSAMDTYFSAFDSQLPEELAGKRDVIFNKFPDIFHFHNEWVGTTIHIADLT